MNYTIKAAIQELQGYVNCVETSNYNPYVDDDLKMRISELSHNIRDGKGIKGINLKQDHLKRKQIKAILFQGAIQ